MQTTTITPFDFEDNMVRIHMDEHGKPWFVASDVAKALGYTNPQKATKDHCKKVNKINQPNDSLGHPPRHFNIIPESDLYRLIMRSNLPSAERFQDWVFEEVLPTLRQTGTYALGNIPMTPCKDDDLACLIKNIRPNMRERLLMTAQRVANMAGSASPQDVEILFSRYCKLVTEGYAPPLTHTERVQDQHGQLRTFIEACLEPCSYGRLTAEQIRTALKAWWREHGRGPVPSSKTISTVIIAFYPDRRRSNGTVYHGVRFVNQQG